MAKKYVCPVCKKEFEITFNSNYAINGQLLCSKECYETLINKPNNSNAVKTDTKDVEVEKKVNVVSNLNTPKPANKKRKTNKSN